MIVVATACVLLAGPLSVTASAQSPTLPPVISDNFDAVHGQAESGGLPNGRPPVECSAVCDELVKAERAAAPNASGRARLLEQLYRWRQRVGRLLPRASTVLGRVTLVAGAFTAGWEVGTAARKLFFSSDMPGVASGAGNNTVYYARRIEKGSVLPGSPNNAHIAPSDGWMGLGVCGGYGCLLESSEYNGYCTEFGPIEPVPSGWTWISAPQYFSFNCGPVLQRSMAFRDAPIEVAPPAGQTATQPPVPWPTTADPGTNGEPTTTTRDRLRGELENNPGDYQTLLDWLCAHLGGDCEDPTGQLIKLPTCHGMTFQACESALRDTGLHGTITKHTLTQDDAIMEEDAGRTTAIYPGGGVRYDTDVTVYVNPDPMPTMTAIETTVADQITQKNPDVDPDPDNGQPRVPAKTVARRCVKAVGASGVAGLTALDCGRLPIFITGYDAVGAAVTNLQALISKPRWALLHRRVADQNTAADRYWYNRVEAGPTCRDAARAEFRGTHGYDADCDEYPFYSTSEGYRGALNDGTLPNIRLINPAQNQLEGRMLGWFYDGTWISSDPTPPWPPCNIPATPDSTIKPLPEPLALGAAQPSAFIAVPVGAVGGRIKTMGICN